MYRQLYRTTLILSSSLALAACVQSTRHSNTMIFGTNTQFGIRAGQSATGVPEVNVGYSRQEAVVMPLVVNNQDDGHTQKPCDPSRPVIVEGEATYAVHPCLLVAINGEAQDSYSVLASFGAKFGGSADASGAKADGGIAQYFATGIAAQMLAIQGGSAVVAGGDASKEAAKTKEDSADIITALYGGEANRKRGVETWSGYDLFQEKLASKIALTKPDELGVRIAAFETAAGAATSIAADCTSPKACADSVRTDDAYSAQYPSNIDKFDQALAAWKTDQ